MRFGSWFVGLLALLMLVPMAAAQEEGTALDSTHWQLVSLDGADLAAGTAITLSFGPDGSAGGSGGCNTYGGSYTLDADGRIAFTGVFSTMMACDPAIMDQETAYFAALQSASAYQLVAGQLVITYGDGQKLVFDPALTLPGTQWRLVTLNGADLAAGSEITLAFDAQGTAAGTAGCNLYTGPYTAEGQNLTFGKLVSTMKACAPALMEQETAYLKALDAASTYALESSTLTISDAAGSAILIFERVLNLAGTEWTLERLGDQAVEIPVTLQFDEAGALAGLGGCNRYNSRYTLSGTAITLQPVVSTRMACDDAVMQIETAYFAALEAVERVEQIGSRLILSTADGQSLVFVSSATSSTPQ